MTGPTITPESEAGQVPAPLDSYAPLHGHAEYRIFRYDLYLDYRVRTNRLAGHASLTGKAVQDLPVIRIDLAGLRAEKVNVNGARARSFRQTGTELIIKPSGPVRQGSDLTLDIRYGGYPGPLRGNWGDVGWEELTDGVLVAGQPTGAPSWFPCNDHPSQKASFGFTITTDPGYYLVCNGRLVSHHAKAGRHTWVYEQAEPMATYLATVQVGRYAHAALPAAATPGPGTPSRVVQFVAAPPALMARALQGLSQQHLMLETFERCFGLYPFAGYTVVVPSDELEIPLEAQTLSIIGPNHLDSGWDSQRLIAHELAHQWFGNSLTCGSWHDIWLHEGFACYAEWIWSEASGNLSAEERAVTAHRLLGARDQDLMVGDPGPERMFDDRVYKRGALALHALRGAAGDALFFEFLRTWTAENRFGTVTTPGLISTADRVCAAVAGFDAANILGPWLYRDELPPLHT